VLLTAATMHGMEQSVIVVTGMTCDHCANAVRAEVARIPGVSQVDVDVASGQVKIAAEPWPDRAALREAVETAGYELAG
jgi:copper chaperone